MKRKKILFLSSWYPTPDKPTHGIFVKRHAEASSLLNDVLVLYVNGGEINQTRFSVSDAPFQELILQAQKKGKSKITGFFKTRKIYAEALKKIISSWGRPDVIHLNVAFPVAAFVWPFLRNSGIPIVVTEHWTGYLPEDGSYRGIIRKIFTQKLISAASALLPVTKHLGKCMQAHGLSAPQVVVPNVVDTDFFVPLRLQNQKNETVFLHLSSLEERQKNPASIIEAFRVLELENKNVRLVIAGDGSSISSLQKLAQAHQLTEKIAFHYLPEKHKLLSLIQSSDAMVLNSNYENLPVVLLEAMSCGKPVISSDVGGIAEYIDKTNGILFSPPDSIKLTDAMRLFCSIKGQFISDDIRNFALQRFSRPVIAKQLNSVYESIT